MSKKILDEKQVKLKFAKLKNIRDTKDYFGVGYYDIKKILVDNNIPHKTTPKANLDLEEVKKKYIELKSSMEKTGEYFTVDPGTIQRLFDKNNVPYKKRPNLNFKEVKNKYIELKSINATSNFYEVSGTYIKRLFDINDFAYEKRKVLNLEEVKLKYQELKSISKVADFYEVSGKKIKYLFDKNNIEYTKQPELNSFGEKRIKRNKKYSVNDDFFRQYNEEAFYFAGLMASDGNIVDGLPRFRIELATKDIDILEKFKDRLNYGGNIINRDRKADTKSGGKFSFLQITSQRIVDDLRNIFNIIPDKSTTYQFPKHLIDNENIRHFIRGYFDGDGHISDTQDSSPRFEIIGNPPCIEFMLEFIKSKVNATSNEITSEYNEKTKHTTSKLRFTGLINVKEVLHWLYDDATIYLDRKYLLVQDTLSLDMIKYGKQNRIVRN